MLLMPLSAILTIVLYCSFHPTYLEIFERPEQVTTVDYLKSRLLTLEKLNFLRNIFQKTPIHGTQHALLVRRACINDIFDIGGYFQKNVSFEHHKH